jgi:hypothetical protein
LTKHKRQFDNGPLVGIAYFDLKAAEKWGILSASCRLEIC